MNVELLGYCSIEGRTSVEGSTVLGLNCIGETIGVSTNDDDNLPVIHGVSQYQRDYVVKSKVFLIHALHGAGLSRTAVLC